MARARNIKPGFFRNADLVELSFETRLLFIGLWTIADREGRLEDRPKQIKMEVFPADNVNVDEMIDQLAAIGMLRRYEVDGVRYLHINNFVVHQNPHHMESPSKIPPPDGVSNKYNQTPISPKQRARIYARDGHACVFCGETESLQIDHVVQVAHGGTSNDDNLRTLCSQCNNKRSKRAKPEANPADSLIPDSLIPDSLITEEKHEAYASVPGDSLRSPPDDTEDAGEQNRSAPCPAEAIVDLYHRHMPDNPKCVVLNDARRRAIRSRWKEAARLTCAPFGYSTRADGLKAWGEFFAVCAASDFLTGKAPPQKGKPPFIADIDFLMSPSGFAKTLENKYHREAA